MFILFKGWFKKNYFHITCHSYLYKDMNDIFTQSKLILWLLQMSLIFNEEGLKDVVLPCVAQKFINHNAVLYKLFTIGNKYFMIERPSLKNFNAGGKILCIYIYIIYLMTLYFINLHVILFKITVLFIKKVSNLQK